MDTHSNTNRPGVQEKLLLITPKINRIDAKFSIKIFTMIENQFNFQPL